MNSASLVAPCLDSKRSEFASDVKHFLHADHVVLVAIDIPSSMLVCDLLESATEVERSARRV